MFTALAIWDLSSRLILWRNCNPNNPGLITTIQLSISVLVPLSRFIGSRDWGRMFPLMFTTCTNSVTATGTMAWALNAHRRWPESANVKGKMYCSRFILTFRWHPHCHSTAPGWHLHVRTVKEILFVPTKESHSIRH